MYFDLKDVEPLSLSYLDTVVTSQNTLFDNTHASSYLKNVTVICTDIDLGSRSRKMTRWKFGAPLLFYRLPRNQEKILL